MAAAALQLAAVVIITLLDLLLGLRGIANETELTTRKTTAAGCRITICDMGISSSCGRRPREDIILEKPRYGAFHVTDLISFSEIEASIRSMVNELSGHKVAAE